MRRLLSSRRLSTTRRDTFPFRHDVFRFLFKSCDVFCRTLPQLSLDRFPSDFFSSGLVRLHRTASPAPFMPTPSILPPD